MEKIILSFQLDEQEIQKLQKLYIQTEARRNLIAFMIQHDSITSDNFYKYHEEYESFYSQYEKEKDRIYQNIIRPIIEKNNIKKDKCIWYINFATCQCSIFRQEE